MENAVRVFHDAVVTCGHRKEMDAIFLSILVGTEPSSYQIAFAIVVPERTWVIPACCRDDSFYRRPRAFGTACRGHVDSAIRRSKIHPEPPSMITNGAGPNSSSIAVHAIPSKLRIQGGQIRNNMAHDLPIDQIPRMQDYHSGGVLHGGGDRVEIIADANRIQVT